MYILHAEYKKHGYSNKFFEENREALTLHKAAKEAFAEFKGKKIPKIKDINAEYAEILARKKQAYAEFGITLGHEEQIKTLFYRKRFDRMVTENYINQRTEQDKYQSV
ncbi:MAG: hypothetical protein Q4E57_06605 [Eubacteriales bacterium]|nr:hypothetical protein [Eubacteriales bacterium]